MILLSPELLRVKSQYRLYRVVKPRFTSKSLSLQP